MAANGKIARGAGAGAVLTGTNGDLFYIAPTPGIRRRWTPTGRLRWLEDEARLEFA
jgi:ribonuclease J